MRHGTRVTQYTMQGEYIATYDSLYEAAKYLNNSAVNQSNILECINGKRASCGNFLWERDIDQEVPGFFSNSK